MEDVEYFLTEKFEHYTIIHFLNVCSRSAAEKMEKMLHEQLNDSIGPIGINFENVERVQYYIVAIFVRLFIFARENDFKLTFFNLKEEVEKAFVGRFDDLLPIMTEAEFQGKVLCTVP